MRDKHPERLRIDRERRSGKTKEEKMRLIDAHALLSAYEGTMKELVQVTNAENISLETLSLLCGAKLIAEAPTIGGWISVKDAMPEEDGQYLVLLNKTHLMVVSFAKKLEEVDREVFAGRDEPGWFEWDTEWCEFYEVTAVTHWMPIPKLPQEVTGDDDNL